jgi:riboflavin kinase/FMN adenylyltransferase
MKKTSFYVATIGVFDGVHLGHRFLLNKVREVAEARGMSSLALTFAPTPEEFFRRPTLAPSREEGEALLPLAERKARLLEAGMDRVEVMAFNREVAEMTAAQFMTLLKERLGVRVLVMGYDHRFGCEQRSDAPFYDAAAESCGLEIVHAPAYGDVSSTRIRELLLQGNVEGAKTLLGYPYTIEGTVVTGDGRGRTLGFPTANLAVQPEKLIPATGVYAVKVSLESQPLNPMTYNGMMNIGLCPTFGGRTVRRVEVHILDFDADIYGQTLSVQLLHHLRDERRFPSVEALVSQLKADAARIRELMVEG